MTACSLQGNTTTGQGPHVSPGKIERSNLLCSDAWTMSLHSFNDFVQNIVHDVEIQRLFACKCMVWISGSPSLGSKFPTLWMTAISCWTIWYEVWVISIQNIEVSLINDHSTNANNFTNSMQWYESTNQDR